MPFNKYYKLMVALLCAFALAACSTTPDEEPVTTETEVAEPVETSTVTEPVISAE